MGVISCYLLVKGEERIETATMTFWFMSLRFSMCHKNAFIFVQGIRINVKILEEI